MSSSFVSYCFFSSWQHRWLSLLPLLLPAGLNRRSSTACSVRAGPTAACFTGLALWARRRVESIAGFLTVTHLCLLPSLTGTNTSLVAIFFCTFLVKCPPHTHTPTLELYFLLSCCLAQSVQVTVLLCPAVLLWVSGRWKTARPMRPCLCASKASAVTTTSRCQITSLIPTPPVLQGGNHTLASSTVLRWDHPPLVLSVLLSLHLP